MTDPDPDATLLAALAALFTRVDPVPPTVRAAASAALSWRDPDAELARLVNDAAARPAELAGVRGRPPRLLTFHAGDLEIELEVTTEGRRVSLVGQLLPTGPAEVTVDHSGGQRTVDADELGRFAVGELAPGLIRLCCAPRPETVPTDLDHPVCTEWFAA
jgi:hypothetical protein